MSVTFPGDQLEPPIVVPSKKLTAAELNAFKENPFENMIKFVVDVNTMKIALGGEMHADAEKALLDAGSNQEDLWGANLWPWQVPLRIEYISLINIRPSQGNRGMEIRSEEIRTKVDEAVRMWVEYA